MMRVEHEYERRGALQYLAAYDVHHARVIGRLEPKTGIKPFARLVALWGSRTRPWRLTSGFRQRVRTR